MQDCSGQIRVCDITAGRTGGVSRVSGMVDGSLVFFESSDADLVPCGEAFGTALLIPALHYRRRLSIDAPIDPVWTRNTPFLVDTVAGWWDLPRCSPVGLPGDGGERSSGVGLFFTAGVDSFHTLLRGGLRVDTLVHVQGFDIPLTDTARLASAEADVRAVADRLGVRCVVVRSNLRTHPLYRPLSWERTHGGALYSVGHLLRGVLGEVILSSSSHWSATRPWGTDWRIDPFWSSSRVGVSHFGDAWWRYQKLEQIAHHPLVRDRLRVCWEHRTEEPNCSHCEKCLRTMITLEAVDALRASTRFDNGPIAERIERVDVAVGPANRREYMYMIDDAPDTPIARALLDLLARSGEPSPRLSSAASRS